MSWKIVKLKEILKQYRVQHIVQDEIDYKQVSILNNGSVILRGNKIGKEIGRKRQFKIDLITYPDTLIFTRQLLLQGSIGIASDSVNGCIVTENMPMFSIQTSKIDKDFLMFFLKSEVFKSRIRLIELSGSAQKSIHEKTFLDLEFMIPSVELQKAIVVELLKLKSNSSDISNEITNQLDLIKKLRQAFLLEAMQGKLVENTNTFETGQQLFAKIKTEKAKLVAEKKIKLGKLQEAEVIDGLQFDVPKHWVWCNLDDICYNITDGTHQTPTYTTSGRMFISAQNVKPFKFMPEKHKYVSEVDYQINIKNRKPEKGDLLIGRVGAGIGETAVIDQDLDFCIYVSVALVQPFKEYINSDYLAQVFNSPYGVRYSKGNISSRGSAGNFNLGRIRSFQIPLPPLHEQEQIVSKLEELMTFCDGLEKSIIESRDYNDMLLEQVLKEALKPQENIKTISIESKKIENPLKTILAGHIINLNNTTDFGRVKFQKLLFLTEYICKINFDSNYIKKVAGPYDDVLIKSIEADFNRMRFFNVVQDKTDNKRVRYTALKGANELESLFLENFADESLRINNTLLKFRPLSWGECELIATLYAVWNNRIIKNEPITDELLYSDFMTWDKQKSKYHSVFHKWLFWMKDERIIPDGWGKYIDKLQ